MIHLKIPTFHTGTQCIWTVYFSVFDTGLETQCIYMNTLYLQCIAHVGCDVRPLRERDIKRPNLKFGRATLRE